MFVNISNHPSVDWDDIQIREAKLYGELVDIPFPQIPAEANEEYILSLAERYAMDIISRFDNQVDVCHIMGELCFCFVLVRRLQKVGFRCVSSCSERMVKEYGQGYKEVLFKFVRFRDYADLNK